MLVAFSISPSGGDDTGGVSAAVAEAIMASRAAEVQSARWQNCLVIKEPFLNVQVVLIAVQMHGASDSAHVWYVLGQAI